METKMGHSLPEIPAELAGLLDLGIALGENHAFGVVSGRTAAAQAACLMRVRDEKLYLALEPRWEDFCPKHLGISRAEADKRIRLYQHFGVAYYELAALTRVSAETYRAIAPFVKDGALHVGDEVIELKAENSRRVTTAVAQLRRELPIKAASQPPPERSAVERIDDLRGRILALAQELQAIAETEIESDNRWRIAATVEVLTAEFARIVIGAL